MTTNGPVAITKPTSRYFAAFMCREAPAAADGCDAGDCDARAGSELGSRSTRAGAEAGAAAQAVAADDDHGQAGAARRGHGPRLGLRHRRGDREVRGLA